MTQPTTKGERFSHLYIERVAPIPDSVRVRVRLAQFLNEYGYDHCQTFRAMLIKELGVALPTKASGGSWIAMFFKDAEVRDVLDAVTIMYSTFQERNKWGPEIPKEWKKFVDRVFKEGNLAYTVDDECGVHPLVDREFERNIATAIAGLGAARYEAARTAFEASERKLEQTPADTKGAIRDTFEAAETLTKLIIGSGKALTASFVKGELEPRLQKLYSVDPVATMVAARMAQSFADWVDAAHPYRHGQNSEEPVRPPEELAVLLVSQGASFVRWLVDLDQQLSAST